MGEKKLNILFFGTDVFGASGGIAEFNRHLVLAMRDIPRVGRIRVLLRNRSDVEARSPDGIELVDKSSRGVAAFVISALQCIHAGPWDLVICGHRNLLPVAALTAKIAGAPLWQVLHGIEAWEPRRWRLRNHIDLYLSVSRFTAQKHQAFSRIPASRYALLPNTFDGRRFFPAPRIPALVDRLGLCERRVLFTLARMDAAERYKGIDEVLECFPRLVADIPNLVYLIGGEGNDRPRLETKARSLGVADRVIFTGFIPETEKADYYRLADLFVMPGWGEGFGIVYLESAACGVPVLGSTLDASAEVIQAAGIGEAVNPKNPEELKAAMVRMLKKPMKGPFEGLAVFGQEAFRSKVKQLLESNGLR